MSDSTTNDDRRADTVNGALSPGSTATGGGTSMDPGGTTEADVTDGRDQDLPKIEGDDSEN
jgi:hypothetical protein